MKQLFILWLVFVLAPFSTPWPDSTVINASQVNWTGPQQWIYHYYFDSPSETTSGIDIKNCSNGDVIIAAWYRDYGYPDYYALLMRVNNQGAVLWSQRYPEVWPHAIIHRTNDEYILVGHHLGSDEDNLLLTCIDGSNGNLLWHQTHTLANNFIVVSVTATNDRGVLLVGQVIGSQNDSWFGLRFDTTGNLLWNNTYAEHHPSSDQCAVTGCRDGTFLLVGTEESSYYIGTKLVAYRLESNGTIRWTQLYNGTAVYAVAESSTTGFLILGQQGIRIDNEGNYLWENTYWQNGADGSIVTCDEGFLVCGSGSYQIPLETRYSIYSVRITDNGTILWQWSTGVNPPLDVDICVGIRSEEGGFYLLSNMATRGIFSGILLVRLPDAPIPHQMIQQLMFNFYIFTTILLLVLSIGLFLLLIKRGSTRSPYRKLYEHILVGNIILYSILLQLWFILWTTGPVYPILGDIAYYPPYFNDFTYQFQNALVTTSGLFFFSIGIFLAIIFQGLEFNGPEKHRFLQNRPVGVTRTMFLYLVIAFIVCLMGIFFSYQTLQSPWTWNPYLQQSFFVLPIILLGLLTAAWIPKYIFIRNFERQERRRE